MAKKKKILRHITYRDYIIKTLCGLPSFYSNDFIYRLGMTLKAIKKVIAGKGEKLCHKCEYILRNQTASYNEKVKHGK